MNARANGSCKVATCMSRFVRATSHSCPLPGTSIGGRQNRQEATGGVVQTLLMWASVSDPNIYLRCGRHEQMLRSISGTLILLTGLFAFSSALWALDSVFPSIYLCAVAAVMWGWLIICIDRSIVGSLKLTPAGPDAVPRYRLLPFIPRLALAIAIGLVISTPIELYIFKDQIAESLNRNAISGAEEDARQTKGIAEATCREHFALNRRLAETSFRRWEASVNDSINGKDESGRPGCDTICKGRMTNRDAAQKVVDDIDRQEKACVARNGEGTGDLVAKQRTSLQEWNEDRKKRLSNKPSLVDKYIELNNYLAGREFARHMAYAIRFLFILIEIVPVLTKLLAGPGMYEQLLSAEHAMLNGKTRSRLDQEQEHSRSFDHGRKNLADLIRSKLPGAFDNPTNLSDPPVGSDAPPVVFAKALYAEMLDFVNRNRRWTPVFDGHRAAEQASHQERVDAASAADTPSSPAKAKSGAIDDETPRPSRFGPFSDALRSGQASFNKKLSEYIDKAVEVLVAPLGGGLVSLAGMLGGIPPQITIAIAIGMIVVWRYRNAWSRHAAARADTAGLAI